jgi:mono/diheme cytochrome c family protein
MNYGKVWSFYNPACLNCVPNDTPVLQSDDNGRYRWDSVAPYGSRYAVDAPSQPGPKYGTQAVRAYPVYKYTEQMNQIWRAKLKGTVWANYKLIGTQWQSGETFPPPNAPALLANTTLETYIQPTASCITCHGEAGIRMGKDSAKIPTDLSFVFPVYAR